ncbi:hypothetical protein WOLCODRAFT_156212 [Wolfiporia cocos MD-104 SS10]|uniref:Rho-GAP domain-containing protein n=1 Tax=Wolfiporia cocos (strain MD-104) TaxID=742152 RepID=A0A2H3JHM7_WOLCO|nr:hypothetical protein WOLCODRAFT_156212 [Wolfiporia cocos MD-104 SS10]
MLPRADSPHAGPHPPTHPHDKCHSLCVPLPAHSPGSPAACAHKRLSLPTQNLVQTPNIPTGILVNRVYPPMPATLLAPRVIPPGTPAIDTEDDRLAHACRQLPVSGSLRGLGLRLGPGVDVEMGWGRGDAGVARLPGVDAAPGESSIDNLHPTTMALDSDVPPALFWVPPPTLPHLRELAHLLRHVEQRLEDYINVDEFLAACKDEERAWAATSARIFGAPLEDVLACAATLTVLGGYTHEVPTVMHVCIEELYCTGIYQPDLFRALPDCTRLIELVHTFNQEAPPPAPVPVPPARSHPSSPRSNSASLLSLRHASMPNVCMLLCSFVNSLPVPLLLRTLHHALWQWCIRPGLDPRRRTDADADEAPPPSAPHSWQRHAHSVPHMPPTPTPTTAASHTPTPADEDEDDGTQVAVAHAVLQLLTLPALGLLTYLFVFFTQIPLCLHNGLAPEDITRIFAHRLLSRPSKPAVCALMTWLLARWVCIALFAKDDAAPAHAPTPVSQGRAVVRRTSVPAVRFCLVPDALDAPEYASEYAYGDGHVQKDGRGDAGTCGVDIPPAQKPPAWEDACTGRPYSLSMSSTTSVDTYASTVSSEGSTEHGYGYLHGHDGEEAQVRIVYPHDHDHDHNHDHDQDNRGHGGQYFVPCVAVRASKTPFVDEHEFLRVHNYFRADALPQHDDSESVYSTGKEESDDAIGTRVERRDAATPCPLVPMSPQPDAAAAAYSCELSSALKHISKLEGELAQTKAKVRTTDVDTDADEARMPVPANAEEVRMRLQMALHERDDAQKLMREFKKFIDDVLEK